MANTFDNLTDEEFIRRAKKQLKDAKKNVSKSRLAFQDLKSWVDKRAQQIAFHEDSAFGKLKSTFDHSDVNKINTDDLEFSMDTLSDYFNVINANELKGIQYEIMANLSSNLKQLMMQEGSNNGNNSKLSSQSSSASTVSIDWKAPKFSGLGNSSPIVKNSKPVVVMTKEKKVEFEKHEAQPTTKITKFEAKASPISNTIKSNDEEDEEEENEDDRISKIAFAMSANLMAALGMDVSKVKTTTDWTPPTQSGLHNSKAIVDWSSKHTSDDIADSKKSSQGMTRNPQGSHSNTHNNEEEDDGDDDDDDGDDDDDDEENSESDSKDDGQSMEENEELPTGNYSANLLDALGIDSSHVDKTTDWKPPAKTGLDNSRPIAVRSSKGIPRDLK